MRHEKMVIERAAERAAEVRSIDNEKKQAFIDGAVFAAKYFFRSLEVHPMEDSSVRKYLDQFRYKDLVEKVQCLLSYREADFVPDAVKTELQEETK